MSKGRGKNLIPEEVLPLLPTDNWIPLLGHGIVASTWQGESWIVQRRQIDTLERWRVGQEAGNLLSDKDLFRGAVSEVILEEEGSYWTLQKRIPGKVFVVNLQNWNQAWSLAKEYLSDVAEAISLLQTLPLPRDVTPSRTVRFWRMPEDELLARARKVFFWADIAKRFPPECRGEEVFSHGDPIIKNFVFGQRAYLIDWEMVASLPSSADALHFISFALKYAPPERWLEVVDCCRPLMSVARLEKRDWLAGVLWGILRDYTAYPNKESDRARWLKGINLLLGS